MFKSVSPLQERDACLALAFLFLLIWFFWRQASLIYIAMGILLLGMVWPGAMRPVAFLWFGLAKSMGHVMSAILLTVIWIFMVLPVGLIRRAMGRDSLRLKTWHDGKTSAFVTRDHQYTAEDLKHPY